MAHRFKVTLKRSGIGRTESQRRTLVGLGLKKLHKSSILEDTPSIRGMLKKVKHLVEVERISEEEAAGYPLSQRKARAKARRK